MHPRPLQSVMRLGKSHTLRLTGKEYGAVLFQSEPQGYGLRSIFGRVPWAKLKDREVCGFMVKQNRVDR